MSADVFNWISPKSDNKYGKYGKIHLHSEVNTDLIVHIFTKLTRLKIFVDTSCAECYPYQKKNAENLWKISFTHISKKSMAFTTLTSMKQLLNGISWKSIQNSMQIGQELSTVQA